MIWYEFAVIKLSHLFESLTKMEIVQRFDATLPLLVNTGTVNIDVGSIETPDLNYKLTPVNKSFSNTCPRMVHYLGNDTTNGVPTGCT